MKYIRLSSGQKSRLCSAFKTSRQNIWRALYYKSDSESCRKLRSAALKMGGRIIHELDITDGFVPNCRTEFDHENDSIRKMVMIFPNDVRAVYDVRNDSATIYANDNEAVRTYWNVSLDSLCRVAYDAQSLSDMYEN